MGHHGIRGARRSDPNKGDKRPMATTYSPQFKASIIARMLPPNNVPVPELVRETNIPKDTLYAWRSKARKEAQGAAAAAAPASGLSSEVKFAVVLETAALNEVELGEYCRARGLYPQAVAAWRASCLQANTTVSAKAERAEIRTQKQQIKNLQRELHRKEKALAEAAALLVLEKKARDLFGEPADGKSTSSSEKP
jgi:transposase-like protein